MRYLLLLLLTGHLSLAAQTYVEGGNTRHRFAQMNIGLSSRVFMPANSSRAMIDKGVLSYSAFDPSLQNRLLIGGTHFWGHTNFYLCFPLKQWGDNEFSPSIETGAKVYPWRLESRKLRPSAGLAWLPSAYKSGEGAELIRQNLLLTAGLSYMSGQHLLELDFGFIPKNNFQYYITPNIQLPVQAPNISFDLSYKWCFETTLGAEKDWKSGRTAFLTDTLSSLGDLNGFTVGVGISSAVLLKRAKYNTEERPFIGQHRFSDVYADVGIGYYWHKPDLQLNITYRQMKSELNAFDVKQLAQRRSIGIETFMFISDYHGFAPFVGLTASLEDLRFSEETPLTQLSAKSNLFRPGIVLGWDIRPNDLQVWYLRTNLKWTPNLNLSIKEKRDISLDQLEINFIQLVVFPGRIF